MITFTVELAHWQVFWSLIGSFLILVIPWFWGVADMYICKRWLKEGRTRVDQSAGALHYWFLKWGCAMQAKFIAIKLGYPGKDLNEILKTRPDDGKV